MPDKVKFVEIAGKKVRVHHKLDYTPLDTEGSAHPINDFGVGTDTLVLASRHHLNGFLDEAAKLLGELDSTLEKLSRNLDDYKPEAKVKKIEAAAEPIRAKLHSSITERLETDLAPVLETRKLIDSAWRTSPPGPAEKAKEVLLNMALGGSTEWKEAATVINVSVQSAEITAARLIQDAELREIRTTLSGLDEIELQVKLLEDAMRGSNRVLLAIAYAPFPLLGADEIYGAAKEYVFTRWPFLKDQLDDQTYLLQSSYQVTLDCWYAEAGIFTKRGYESVEKPPEILNTLNRRLAEPKPVDELGFEPVKAIGGFTPESSKIAAKELADFAKSGDRAQYLYPKQA